MGATVLLVDDDPDDAFFHKMLLEETGMVEQVHVCEDADSALQYLTRAHEDAGSARGTLAPDLVLVDLNLPGTNGWEFIESFKALSINPVQTKLAVLTGSLNPDDEYRALGTGVVRHFFIKPLHEREMADYLSRTRG